jgi:hypothetical protein
MLRAQQSRANGDGRPVEWTADQKRLLDSFDSPAAVQAFLDEIPYATEVTFRSPHEVMRDRKANCMEGAVFAAAALEQMGLPPVIVNLKAVRDDDHVIAIFHMRDRIGALAKSNYAGLRYRSPVYASLHELAMSYFDQYYNPDGELTLRAYTRPLDLRISKFRGWQTRESNLDDIADHLDALPAVELLPDGDESILRKVDERLYRAGLMGADAKGLYGANHQ